MNKNLVIEIYERWKKFFPKITEEQSLMCEKLATKELNGLDSGKLSEYMKKNKIIDDN